MDQQRRCLLGMINGAPIPVLSVSTTLLHILPKGPPVETAALDVVTLYVHNAGPSAADITIQVDTVALIVNVPAGAIVRVFDETPFNGPQPNGSSSLIRGQGSAKAEFRAWGWFVRTQG